MSVKNESQKTKSVAINLSRWFLRHARVLPWREDPHPYRVWVSEIMLQQTQVATVLPYFDKFMKRFPTVGVLAEAGIEEVYQLWAGLGYYSRARNLHLGAQFMAKNGFPKDRDGWLEVPGVGPYTAGAICSIALNQREPIVDGNVVRVLSRVYKIGKLDAKFTPIWEKARELVSLKATEPRVLNQSLMELGALVCRPKNPLCHECPIERECAGKKEWGRYPPPKKKKEWKQVEESKWVMVKGKGANRQVYLEHNHDTKWRKGLWDFPDSGSLKELKTAQLKDEFILRYVVTIHQVKRAHKVLEVSKLTPSFKGKFKGKWFAVEALPGVPSPVAKAILKLQEQDTLFSQS